MLQEFRGHEGVVMSGQFSPDGEQIVTTSRDMTVRLWNLDGEQLAVLRGHHGVVWSASFSPSGDRILTASYDRTARLWLAKPDDLLKLADKRAFRGFTPGERNRYPLLLD